ncbi:transposase [Rhodocaloribacter litoris]|uniref:RNA-guided endonuclease InsQ/TnpB family protein n=1 Tax=Rhodocaloribacter litoris TaxID=2558931 RepID=UPI00141F5DFE|nr:RNA-guided endonuclease TnpB family protein [Rhodocaloribacter litoris]QXD15675.1 transposase [Rhodocaloribacter litoris]
MKLTAQIRLDPSPEQADALLRTMETANAACNAISEHAWATRTFSKYELQKAIYHDIRGRFALSAQVVVRCLGKVADAYKLDRNTKRTFRKRGAIVYDSRILRYYTERREVSIWTMTGRERIPYTVGEHHARLLAYQQGESDLIYRKGRFYLLTTCDVPEEDEEAVDGVLGVDLGIAQIATDSDGDSFSGEQVESKRKWYAERRAVLQSVGTRSARRRLRQLSGRERRFRADVNHQISKTLVRKAKDTKRAIALEDLTGIRTRTTVRKSQRARHHSWSFYQLRQFIEYKAKLAGIPVLLVDPAYTSRTCSQCGHCEKANRKDQVRFECQACGFALNADRNAAINIAARGAVMRPMVSRSDHASPEVVRVAA